VFFNAALQSPDGPLLSDILHLLDPEHWEGDCRIGECIVDKLDFLFCKNTLNFLRFSRRILHYCITLLLDLNLIRIFHMSNMELSNSPTKSFQMFRNKLQFPGHPKTSNIDKRSPNRWPTQKFRAKDQSAWKRITIGWIFRDWSVSAGQLFHRGDKHYLKTLIPKVKSIVL
jgi:hypothetical protein